MAHKDKYMNKTLYIRDEDLPIWDRARELAGDRLSPVIVESLKRFVAEREALASGFERIVVEFNDASDNGLPKAKAFYGRWIIDRDGPWRIGVSMDGDFIGYRVVSVAETAKGGVVVYRYFEAGNSPTSESQAVAHGLLIFRSFEEAAAHSEVSSAVAEALRRRGVPVEELDI